MIAGTILATAASASAAVNLVSNGSFEINSGSGQIGSPSTVADWSVPSGGYTWVYTSAASAQAGAPGQYGPLSLWGPNNGSANGLTESPDGGSFIAQDSAFQNQPIQQTVGGLTIGNSYNVSFYWAASQQTGYYTASYDNWQVSLGAQSFTTSTLNIPAEGFSGWQQQTFTYTATSTSEVLSFFANGGPPGVPPFALLDGVSLTSAVPEPSTLVAGAAVLLPVAAGLFRSRNRRQNKA